MPREHISHLPLPLNWKPSEIAKTIHSEVEKLWSEGWVFQRAESDALMESLCLHFEWPEESDPHPGSD